MRFFRAVKVLFKHYGLIFPVYAFASLSMILVTNVAPLVGTLLVLPVGLGVAYTMYSVIETRKKPRKRAFTLGFEKHYVLNIGYLAIRQVAYLAPLLLGVFLSGLLSGYVIEIQAANTFVALNFLLFALPSAVVSLMLAMVPFLLADPKFDQSKHNPLKVSASIMKGNYLRLLFTRLFFIPWLLWTGSGLALVFVSYFSSLFGGGAVLPNLTLIWLLSTPVLFLVITPWYQMVHADLYVSLRHKVKGYQ